MDTATINRLVEVACSAPSADNTQPWRVEWDGDSLRIRYDRPRVNGQTFPAENPASLLSIGGLIENIDTLARAWGLEPALELAEDPGAHSDALYARIALQAAEQPPGEDDEIVRAVLQRHTNRAAFAPTPLPDALLDDVSGQRLGSARSWSSHSPEQRGDVARLVETASRIRFSTREAHEWLARSLRFTPTAVASADGLDVATLALPPGGRLFLRLIADWRRLQVLNRVGAFRILSAIDAAPVRRGPCLLAVIAGDNPRGCIDAGRLMVRLWTSLNRQGVAVHPYYVVADQLARLRSGGVPREWNAVAREIAGETREVFGLRAGEAMHMILRVGFPRKTVKKSLRLPLAEVYAETPRRRAEPR